MHSSASVLRLCLPLLAAALLPALPGPAAYAQLPGSGTPVLGSPGDETSPLDLDNIVTARAAWLAAERFGPQRRLLILDIDIREPFHINPDRPRIPAALSFLIPTSLNVAEAPAGWHAMGAIYPQPKTIEVAYTGQPMPVPVLGGRVLLLLPFRFDAEAQPGPLTVELRYQACDDRRCLRPRTITLRIQPDDLVADADTPAVEAALTSFDPAIFDGPVTPMGVEAFDAATAAGQPLPAEARTGLYLLASWMLFAMIGGFLLNLTPCVLPVIPLKIMGLSRSAGSRGRCLALGLAMAAGVIAFWMGLAAAITLATGFTATNQLFQYPLFTIGVGIVIAAMAVGMCGLFAVQLPQFVYRINPGHDTLVGSFGFGIMTAILSTPCTAPVMGAALAWAALQHPAATLSVFAALGLGMALPYLVLAAWPALIAKVPRTGPGSELLKQVMGLLMLAAAAYFVGTGVSGLLAVPGEAPTRAYWWAVAACLAAAGLWLAWRTWRITDRRAPRAVFTALGAAAIAAALGIGLHFTAPGPVNWQYYTPDRFAAAMADDKVVVLEFTAEWCLNCKALEHTVLNDTQVVAALRAPDVIPMKVDLTGDNPDGNARLAAVGRLTIPLLVIYDRGGRAVFTRDFYTVGQVVAAIEQARASGPPSAEQRQVRGRDVSTITP